MLYKIILTGFFTLTIALANAQTKYTHADYSAKPVWINMMTDSAVNYFQAIEAFDIYWSTRTRPEEPFENDTREKKLSRKEERKMEQHKKRLAKMSVAERNEFDQINYQYKLFTNWMNDVKPFVQPDGSIRLPR